MTLLDIRYGSVRRGNISAETPTPKEGALRPLLKAILDFTEARFIAMRNHGRSMARYAAREESLARIPVAKAIGWQYRRAK
jgi:hypothetical protein